MIPICFHTLFAGFFKSSLHFIPKRGAVFSRHIRSIAFVFLVLRFMPRSYLRLSFKFEFFFFCQIFSLTGPSSYSESPVGDSPSILRSSTRHRRATRWSCACTRMATASDAVGTSLSSSPLSRESMTTPFAGRFRRRSHFVWWTRAEDSTSSSRSSLIPTVPASRSHAATSTWQAGVRSSSRSNAWTTEAITSRVTP